MSRTCREDHNETLSGALKRRTVRNKPAWSRRRESSVAISRKRMCGIIGTHLRVTKKKKTCEFCRSIKLLSKKSSSNLRMDCEKYYWQKTRLRGNCLWVRKRNRMLSNVWRTSSRNRRVTIDFESRYRKTRQKILFLRPSYRTANRKTYNISSYHVIAMREHDKWLRTQNWSISKRISFFFSKKIVIHDLDTILEYNEYDTVILIYS